MIRITATIEKGDPKQQDVWMTLTEFIFNEMEDKAYWLQVHPDEVVNGIRYLQVDPFCEVFYFGENFIECGDPFPGSVGPCDMTERSNWPSTRVRPLQPGETVSFVIGND